MANIDKPLSGPALQSAGSCGGPSTAERQWRQTLRDAGYQVSLTSLPVHLSQFVSPHGDRQQARIAYQEFLDQEPDNTSTLEGLCFLLQMEGRFAELLPLRRRLHEIELRNLELPEEQRPATLDFLLARDGLIPPPQNPPPAYVAQLFDRSAESFDQHLTQKLNYRGPEVVVAAVTGALADQSADSEPGELAVLDAGCGTGLAGALLRPLAARLEGVDLSSQMLTQARRRQIYDHLELADLQDYLAAHPQAYDLIVAIDVLIYLGDLRDVLQRIADALRPGGIFGFSVEQGDPETFHLRPTGHFAHGHQYLTRTWDAVGLQTISVSRQSLRQEADCPVPGLVCVVQRPV